MAPGHPDEAASAARRVTSSAARAARPLTFQTAVRSATVGDGGSTPSCCSVVTSSRTA
ncbi:hypothetical protein AB0L17_15680 [Streptomyces cellulosae]